MVELGVNILALIAYRDMQRTEQPMYQQQLLPVVPTPIELDPDYGHFCPTRLYHYKHTW